VNRVLGVPEARIDENELASAGLGATWPRSVVVTGGVGTGSVA